MSEARWTNLLAEAADLRAQGKLAAGDEAYRSLFAAAASADATIVLCQGLMGHARLLHQWGRVEEATELAELTSVVAERCGHPGIQARALNLLGVVRLQQQDWTNARDLLSRALEGAFLVRDDELVGAIATNLGAIYNIQGNFVEARSHYLESIGSSVRCEARTQLVMGYNNLGMVCSDSQEWMEALVYFGRAIEIAEEEGDESLVALLNVNQAEPLIEIGEFGRAIAALSSADVIARKLGHAAIQADTSRFLGRISRVQGDYDSAEQHLTESLAIADRAGLELHRAEALEESARLHQSRGSLAAALDAFRIAHEVYMAVGATSDAERVSAVQRELLTTR